MSANSRILIIAHKPLAQALYNCALHVFSDIGDELLSVDIEPYHDAQLAQQDFPVVHSWLKASAAPLLILTDVVGATPANAALSLAQARLEQNLSTRVLVGVNVPMLLRAWTYRYLPLKELIERALSGGVHGINELSV